MKDLQEKVEILSKIVSDISIRLHKFEQRFDAVENRVCSVDRRVIGMTGRFSDINVSLSAVEKKVEKAKEGLSQEQFVSLKRAIAENGRRIDSLEFRDNSSHERQSSSVNVAFHEEPREVIELRSMRQAQEVEEAVGKLPTPDYSGKSNEYHLSFILHETCVFSPLPSLQPADLVKKISKIPGISWNHFKAKPDFRIVNVNCMYVYFLLYWENILDIKSRYLTQYFIYQLFHY